jgi:hypothetical protein
MLAASKNTPDRPISVSSGRSVTTDTSGNTAALKIVEKALNSVGSPDKLKTIAATRLLWKATKSASGSKTTAEVERIAVYPDRLYIETRPAVGPITAVVVTPEFAYLSNSQGKTQLPPAIAGDYRTAMKFDTAYVAQHMGEFTFALDGQETVGSEKCDRVRIKLGDGNEEVWTIDGSGKTLRRTGRSSTGDYSIQNSDFRGIDDLTYPYHRITATSGSTIESSFDLYQVNPPKYALNAALFDPPKGQTANTSYTLPAPGAGGGLTIRVLEGQSVPYVQKIGGGPSTSCTISGGSTTAYSANTIGNYTYGNANTSTGLHMTCNTYDTTMNWPHVLNVMLVEASDGNAYMIACDRAWAWSKCVPLRAGDTFNARQTSKGLAVQALNAKGKESEPTYAILQSKTLR